MRLRRISDVLTVVETPLFQRQWPLYWTGDARGRFAEGRLSSLRSTPSRRRTTSRDPGSRKSAVPSKTSPLNSVELAAYEAGRDLADDLLQSVREMKAGRVQLVTSPVVEARRKTGLSQSEFAALLGVSVRTLQGWEQGRKQPSGAARTLLALATTNPRALLGMVAK